MFTDVFWSGDERQDPKLKYFGHLEFFPIGLTHDFDQKIAEFFANKP